MLIYTVYIIIYIYLSLFMPYPSASSDPVPCPPALHCGTTFSLESPFHCNCRVATRSRRNGLPPMTPMAIKRVNLTPNIVSRCQVEKTRLRPRKRVQLTVFFGVQNCEALPGEIWWRRREWKVHKKSKIWKLGCPGEWIMDTLW